MEKKKKGKAGSLLLNLLIVLIFLAGITIMLYPMISNWLNKRNSSKAVMIYNRALEELTPEDFSGAFEKAREYNRRLKENPAPFSEISRTEGYEEALSVDDTGIMGYVTIEKIRVRLPFYHGTEERVLQTAIGHVEGSSLPTGDRGEHAVLSAHRGLPTAELFTDLPELQTGDTFVLHVLDQKMTYEVDQILTVLPDSPEAFAALAPVEGEDLCTLMTCTPYGINTHRLLVRGHRTEDRTEQQEGVTAAAGGNGTGQNSAGNTGTEDAGQSFDRYIPYAAGAAAVIFLLLWLIPGKKK